MANKVLRLPLADPRRVIHAAANHLATQDLLSLSPMIEVTTDGWRLVVERTKANREPIQALLSALGVEESSLTEAAANARASRDARPLGNELLSYLANRDWSDEPDAAPVLGEKLIVVGRVTDVELVKIFAALNLHATVCRAAMFQGAGEDFVLFHLRDDPSRGSSLQPFLQHFPNPVFAVLNAYATDYGTIFLAKAPPRDTLRAVGRLMHTAPELFGFGKSQHQDWPASNLLFCFTRTTDIAKGEAAFGFDAVHDLRDARFFGNDAYFSATRPALQLARPHQQVEAAAAAMSARLVQPASEFARPLRLVSGVHSPPLSGLDQEVIRLRSEIERTQRRLDRLESRIEHPVLFARASNDAFPRLAQILRTAIGDAQNWSGISYACLDSVHGSSEIHHVFRFEPTLYNRLRGEAALSDNESVAWFWSEPTWTRLYARGGRVMPAVPFGDALSPVPHSWTPADIDTHLIDMVNVWNPGGERMRVEDHPVLFFGQDPSGDRRAPLRVDLVLGTAFGVMTGSTIAWLNDVQLARNRTTLPAEIAADSRLVELAAMLPLQAQSRDAKALEINAIREEFKDSADALLLALKDEIKALREKVEERSEDARSISADIVTAAKTYSELIAEAEALRALHGRLVGRATARAQTVPLLARGLAEDMEKANRRFQERTDRVSQSLQTMTNTLRAFQNAIFFWRN